MMFLAANDRRHKVYVKLTGTRGGTLQGPVDADWMHREWSRHVTLAKITNLRLSSADTKVLSLPGKWKTQQQLIDWMELHNRLHLHIEQVLKLH
jgi:hypothetical protein